MIKVECEAKHGICLSTASCAAAGSHSTRISLWPCPLSFGCAFPLGIWNCLLRSNQMKTKKWIKNGGISGPWGGDNFGYSLKGWAEILNSIILLIPHYTLGFCFGVYVIYTHYLELRKVFSNLTISKSGINTKNWGIHIDALRLHSIKRIEIFYQNTL